MANNRIYIVNKETGEATMLAKSFGDGWEIRASTGWLEKFMSSDDWESSVGGGPSKLVLMTEGELPADIVYAQEPLPSAPPQNQHAKRWWKFWG